LPCEPAALHDTGKGKSGFKFWHFWQFRRFWQSWQFAFFRVNSRLTRFAILAIPAIMAFMAIRVPWFGKLKRPLTIQENIPLAPLTTFKVGGPAHYFVDCQSESEVQQAVTHADEHKLPLFVLGGGSNLVVADEGWPGLVLKVSICGIEETATGFFRVGAGEDWDRFVAHAVKENYAGIECLSGIPGTVGGTPVQNVGAYGQEVAETIVYVRVLEIATGKIIELSKAECGFSYRRSIFNGEQRDRYIVLWVAYQLTKDGEPRIEYADLKNYFAGKPKNPTLQEVRDAVREIRRSKAMLIVEGDEDCRSAGSFFKNPIVTQSEAERIQSLAQEKVPGKTLPKYPAPDGKVKLPAAWLLEQAGFHKGYTRGPVGISRKHSLAIVNRGGATAKDIIDLKDEIQKRVLEVWGVQLEPEPVFLSLPRTRVNG
jgi:UDP-N-acetylmuramate dehydrogenase